MALPAPELADIPPWTWMLPKGPQMMRTTATYWTRVWPHHPLNPYNDTWKEVLLSHPIHR